jgi:hypothetical protein
MDAEIVALYKQGRTPREVAAQTGRRLSDVRAAYKFLKAEDNFLRQIAAKQCGLRAIVVGQSNLTDEFVPPRGTAPHVRVVAHTDSDSGVGEGTPAGIQRRRQHNNFQGVKQAARLTVLNYKYLPKSVEVVTSSSLNR